MGLLETMRTHQVANTNENSVSGVVACTIVKCKPQDSTRFVKDGKDNGAKMKVTLKVKGLATEILATMKPIDCPNLVQKIMEADWDTAKFVPLTEITANLEIRTITVELKERLRAQKASKPTHLILGETGEIGGVKSGADMFGSFATSSQGRVIEVGGKGSEQSLLASLLQAKQ